MLDPASFPSSELDHARAEVILQESLPEHGSVKEAATAPIHSAATHTPETRSRGPAHGCGRARPRLVFATALRSSRARATPTGTFALRCPKRPASRTRRFLRRPRVR